MQIFRRRATEEEMAAGKDEMIREQRRLAKEAVDERMKEQEGEEAQEPDPAKDPVQMSLPAPDQLPMVQSIATPSQGSPPEEMRPGETRALAASEERKSHGHAINEGPAMIGGMMGPGDGARSPLFNEEQLRRIEELQRAAPLLMGRQPELEVGRPAWLVEEEKKSHEAEMQKERIRERQRVFQRLNDSEKIEMMERIQTLEEDVRRMSRDNEGSRRENEDLKKRNEALYEVNRMMTEEVKRMKEQEKKGREEFGTPADYEDETEKPKRPWEEDPVNTPRRGIDPEERREKKESPIDSRMMMKGMLKLMEGMQVMQTQLLDVKKDSGLEVVRGGMSELPRLPEWKAETDLSNGSQQWWEATLASARDWYSTRRSPRWRR